jgi:hypothetical protein
MKKRVFILSVISLVAIVALAAYFGFSSSNMSANPINNDPIPETPASEAVEQSVARSLAQKYDRTPESINIQVQLNTGEHAKGSVQFSGEPGGGLWFAAYTESGWETVFDGNGIVSCEIVEKHNFPVDIISGCIDTDGEIKHLESDSNKHE